MGENVENLFFVGTGNFTAVGNQLNNSIAGGAGNDILNGGLGADLMFGGAGNDDFGVTDAGDVVVEGIGGGVDSVWTSLNSYTLGENIENLFFGGTGNFTAVGNTLNNVFAGGIGNDTFVFGAGFGNDQIFGFNDGQDRLDISAFNVTAANFAGNVNIADAGADTLISFGGADSIRLVGVADATTITATDFILAT